MKFLLIGNGAREHALGAAIVRSPQKPELVVFADKINPGLQKLAAVYEKADSLTDFAALEKLVEREKPELAVVGPEAPIAAGAADLLEQLGVGVVAPKKSSARLESSKSFTRDLLQKHDIPGNPDFLVFEKFDKKEEARIAIRNFMKALDGQFVVKADGLKSGKGVKVVGDHLNGVDDGLHYALECLEEDGRVVIEEKLIGEEFSAMFLTDGETLAALPVSQDHKRAFEDDRGPNTGGMGTYSDETGSLPFLDPEDLEAARMITAKVLRALNAETGETFCGVMYGGFIATKNGVKLIEYNARFGDPEAMNVFPILKTDFVEICQKVTTGKLSELPLEFEQKATVVKYAVPEGYPNNPVAGSEIKVLGLPEGCEIFYAAVDVDTEGRVLTGTSRAIAVVGIADDLTAAERIAEEGINKIEGQLVHRRDIGTPALVEKRIRHLKEIRSA
ncbi:MAG: phosphoribosylamine--glycine ligase [Candidatus Peribacteraceae bacterium]|nr:phosphoribosylamine--glycine ligase [Candidatus Peribacteraceae bacterium]